LFLVYTFIAIRCSAKEMTQLRTSRYNLKYLLSKILQLLFVECFAVSTYELFMRLQLVDFNTMRTGEADLRFYITTVQDG